MTPEKNVEGIADKVTKPALNTTVGKRHEAMLSELKEKLSDATTKEDEGKPSNEVSKIYPNPSRPITEKKPSTGADTAGGETRQPSEEKNVEKIADEGAKPVTDTTVAKRFQQSMSKREKLGDVTTKKDEGKSSNEVSKIIRSPSRSSTQKKPSDGANTASGETRQPGGEKPSDGDVTASTQPQLPKGDEHSDGAANVETKSSASKKSGNKKKNRSKNKEKKAKDDKHDEAISTGSTK